MDPAAITSVAHSLFLAGDYAGAIECYGGRAAYYLDAAAWAAMGKHSRAQALLRDRLEQTPLSKLMTALMSSLLALLEGRNRAAVRLMNESDTSCDPEIQFYFAWHYAKMGLVDAAVTALESANQSGFTCAPHALMSDLWFVALQKHPRFASLLSDVQSRVAHAKRIFESYSDLDNSSRSKIRT